MELVMVVRRSTKQRSSSSTSRPSDHTSTSLLDIKPIYTIWSPFDLKINLLAKISLTIINSY
jgi:hypothetical protein